MEIISNLDYLKRKVIENLGEAVKDPNRKFIAIPQRASGSASGLPFEQWTKEVLNERGLKVFLQEEFVKELVNAMKNKRIVLDEITKTIRERTWYGLRDYVISREQLKSALEGKEVPTYQQSMADLVLFYGKDLIEDINDVILINVKSHDIEKVSRPPNIISAKRVLEFIRDVLIYCPNLLDKINLWFLGIYYRRRGRNAEIIEVYAKDFFKLDVTRIPIINFDAAIQIQWHVKDMVEIPDINRAKFIENLAKEYLKRWERFAKRRSENVRQLVNELINLIGKNEKKSIS
ncbi:MAG: HincII family type II restriction endonuclease [Desulfurococcaceae archaeon]